ncbi:cytoskeletal protein CcmA (bactofilin family) [Prosthecobacter fusiformis]|uniref:Cytoskeletal protein CcmA (Bactofilin family) n=2 Tax=Prosthecobacter fusiformis TaxID=48464 RepID=A0A4R7S7H1_9BACT|nr:cytoskeletal protein CcmA (bactofilin family) [Prosthecobacter fusiformis]
MLRQIIGQPTEGQKETGRAEAPAPASTADRGPSFSAPVPAAQPQRASNSYNMTSSKNVLANDVEIKGSIKFSHDLIIDGKIEGEVQSDGSLTVGENALIKGEIKTRSVIIFGKVEGNITVLERCELKSNAILVGDIEAGTLSIEEGATFMGASKVGRKPEPAKPAPLGGNRPAPAQP